MDFVTGAMLGGMLYDVVKAKTQVTADVIKNTAKAKMKSWLFDDQTTEKIVNHVNVLGYIENESESDYNNRLKADSILSLLLATPTQQTNQQVSASHNTKIAGMDYHETIHNHYPIQKTEDNKPTSTFILPTQARQLIGREEILSQLLETLTQPNNNSRLLINGMGGVGKTSICRVVAHQCAKLVNSVVWLDAQGGISNGLQAIIAPKLNIDISQPNWLGMLIEKLNLSLSPAILFLDNLEASAENNAVLHQLAQLNWHVVATSRDFLPGFEKLNIDVLSTEQCIDLFLKHYENTVDVEEQPTLVKLIRLAGEHTLTVELLAKIASDSVLSVTQLYEQVSASGFDLSPLTGATVDGLHSGTVDEVDRQHQLHEHLSKLFTMSKLDEDEKNLLGLFAILPNQGYHCHDELIVWFGLEDAKPLMDLVKKGWLLRDKEFFSMHPVIGFVVVQGLRPSQSSIEIFTERFTNSLKSVDPSEFIVNAVYINQIKRIPSPF
jgi:hypothetical protein